jgi:hypothetical protein
MRRLIRVLLPLIVLMSAIAIGIPASATPPDTPTCAGEYDFTLSSPMPNPTSPPADGIGFTMTRTSGPCTGSGPYHPPPESFWGYLDGNCGAATGGGSLPDGHWFEVTWDGTTLTMKGFVIFLPGGTRDPVEVSGTGAFTITSVLDCAGTSFDTVGAMTSVPTARACAGIGTMSLGSPFSTLSPFTTTSFSLGLAVGACTNLGVFYANGIVTGNCEFATGSGVTNGGATFTLVWVENRLFFTGNFDGISNVAPVIGQSCVSGAQDFVANNYGVQLL